VAIGLLWNVNGGKISLVHEKAEKQIQVMGVERINKLIERMTERASGKLATSIWGLKPFQLIRTY